MREDERDQQHKASERQAKEGDYAIEWLKMREEMHRGIPDQRRKHHGKSKCQERERADKDKKDGLRPQPPPRPVIAHAISPVKRDPDGFYSIRRKIDRQDGADRQ